MNTDASFAANRWWIWIAIFLCIVGILWATKLAYIAYIDSTSDQWLTITIAITVYCVAVFVAAGAVNLCSVELSRDFVSQIKLFSKGKFVSKQQLPWQEITTAMVKPGAYLLSSPSITIEIHTMVFDNPSEASNFVQKMLPDRLKTQAA